MTVVTLGHVSVVMKVAASAESLVQLDQTTVDVSDNKKVCKLVV